MPPVAPVSSTFPFNRLTARQSNPALARKHADRRREPVQEAARPDGTDFARGEESRARCTAELALHRARVVVGFPEHRLSTAVAGEYHRAGGGTSRECLHPPAQHPMEVLVRGQGIPGVQADDLAFMNRCSDSKAP